jgi:serine/threonine-protein kinase
LPFDSEVPVADRDGVCSWREALPTLDNTAKAIIIVGIVIEMKFIHLPGVIHRDLKPANILLDEHGHPKIADIGSSGVRNSRLTMTSGIGMPLCMAPEISETANCTAAVDVHSFPLIAHEVLVGEPVFPATATLPVLFPKVPSGGHQPFPESMDAGI